MKKGDRVFISGDTSELWIEDYNVRVSSSGIVVETPKKYAKKVLVSIDNIDNEQNVIALVRKNKISLI